VSDDDLLAVVLQRLQSFERSVFRLESRDDYVSDAEDDELRQWFAGEPMRLHLDPDGTDYQRRVHAACEAGKTWRRVHAVTAPTPYVRWEVEGYAQNEVAGEEIGILQARDLIEVFGEQPPDFWLVDDVVVLEMRYDAAGRIAEVPVITDPEQMARYRRLRDIALVRAIPVRVYRGILRRQTIPAPSLPVEAT
jgi:hypothetical protein